MREGEAGAVNDYETVRSQTSLHVNAATLDEIHVSRTLASVEDHIT